MLVVEAGGLGGDFCLKILDGIDTPFTEAMLIAAAGSFASSCGSVIWCKFVYWSVSESNPPTHSPKNSTTLVPGGAKSGALAPAKPVIDPDLAALIDAWPRLPEPIKAGILALVRVAGA